jgi:hypothetical protein
MSLGRAGPPGIAPTARLDSDLAQIFEAGVSIERTTRVRPFRE